MIARFGHDEFDASELAAQRDVDVSVVLPARDEEGTVGEIVATLRSLPGLVDQVVVVDSCSADRTAEVARAAGAEVHAQESLLPELGPPLGKGDAMWRALSVARGEVVVYLDSDTIGFSPRFLVGLLGPLLRDPEVQFVKGGFGRPFGGTGDDGGRVTELCARPLLTAFRPELASLRQPLAGEVAVRRGLLEELPFATGFGVEIGMLLDAWDRLGPAGLVEADLGERRQPHQPLFDLGPMAYAVVAAVMRREGVAGDDLPPYRTPDGRVVEIEQLERPPFASLRSRA